MKADFQAKLNQNPVKKYKKNVKYNKTSPGKNFSLSTVQILNTSSKMNHSKYFSNKNLDPKYAKQGDKFKGLKENIHMRKLKSKEDLKTNEDNIQINSQ